MSGIQTAYHAQNADIELRYWKHEQCIVRLWMPSGYESLTDMPVYIQIPGGGWDAPHADATADIHEPTTTLVTADPHIDDLLADGWVIARMEWPHGINAVPENRVFPVSRWPATTLAICHCVQFLKTHATSGRITGTTASTLATSHLRYVLDGTSSGGIEAMMAALLPDGSVRYDEPGFWHGGDSPFDYTHNHRVRGVLATDAIPDFRKLASGSVSAAAISRFRARENVYVNPSFSQIAHGEKLRASVLWLAEQNYPENQDVGFFAHMDEGSVPDGQSAPAVGANGSFLGSGTTLSYATGEQTGTFTIGETVTGATSGTGTVKARSAFGTTAYLYIERTTTATFEGVVTGGTSGATVSANYTCGGNNDRLAFLSPAAALAVWDAAGTGEIADHTNVHEQIGNLALKRQLDANGNTLSRFYTGNDYVAGLTAGYDPAFTWSSGNYNDEIVEWIQTDLGITT